MRARGEQEKGGAPSGPKVYKKEAMGFRLDEEEKDDAGEHEQEEPTTAKRFYPKEGERKGVGLQENAR